MELSSEDNNLTEKVLPPIEQESDVELETTVKKYLRGEGADLETLKDKKLKTQLASREKLYGKSAKTAAKIEKWLLPAEAGYLETDGLEKTWRVKQTDIANEVDLLSSRNQYDIVLPDFGPYKLDFTASGRHMIAGGRKGHLALVDMMSMNLIKEIQVKETVRDVAFLHNEQFFAAAQKKYAYIYGRDGTELHCLKERGPVSRLRFLKNHFLLASVNKSGQLHYQDVTYGGMVASIRTGKGRTDVMEVNPYNGVVALGHTGGTVTMWKPTSQAPLVQMQCHPGPVSSVAFHPNGHLMATSGKERKLKIWDLRKFEEVQTIHGFHAKTLSFSQKGLLAAGTGSFVQILGDSSGGSSSHNYSRYMNHSMVKGYQIEKLMFRPYEDVIGIGHSMGWSSILIPGSGEPNFDSWVANPFETSKQRREKEVHLLLDKLPPETIMLDPSKIGAMKPSRRKEKQSREEIEAEKEVAIEAAKSTELKKKTKGRNKPSKRTKKKKEMVENAKRTFPEQGHNNTASKKRRIGEDAAAELPASLKRFARKN
ncbi:PREDICTED: probable U3 small nucleolar RNA-associated protein 7 [Camelina sativa]|uniref:Probable U3 small nucleolar RNA-associated protein 7 n=1 Tax=Camelina sativa TaxID=90675 RepID=A0ABM0XIY4_CAMSA|nr:PREDICTED: probable U3 small nucleolar RNA-associated protein 7 [Camelina sativa]